MDRDQFFNHLFDERAREHTDGFQRQLSYESRIVRRVFNECGVKVPSWGKLVNLCKDETGTHEMSCAWFNSAFPRFPARLCGKRIGYCGYRRDDAGNKTSLSLYQLTIGELLTAKNNILVRAISKALHVKEVDPERPFVLVFPIVRKFFVAHNLDVAPARGTMPRVSWRFEENLVINIEQSASFFSAVGPDWFQD